MHETWLAEPLLCPKGAMVAFLVGALEREQLRLLAAKRSNFGGVTAGVDGWALSRVDAAPGLDYVAAGALRAARTANVVTQAKVGGQWGRGTQLCPYCARGRETALHRYWYCHRWAGVRALACGAVDEASVLEEAPALTLR